ncbi:ATP-dependent DNA ligase [Bradyrhizobium sp. DASA03120]|uniref:ATP-dependent DNA ligase n=1 Tax=Bradyrhizobium sp. SMVTL-02 TaxID=3395917 RepID=UPI003F70BE17
MRSFEFCLPTKGTTVPDGPDWLHEVKYDGYRLRLERDGDRVRLITRGGYNWSTRYPWIVEAARKVRQKQFVLDGEAVVLSINGISDFNALHSRRHDDEVQFCAFDILAEGGDDLRTLPLSMRKTKLERLLARAALKASSSIVATLGLISLERVERRSHEVRSGCRPCSARLQSRTAAQ